MSWEDVINDVSALGGLPFFFVIGAVLVIASGDKWLRMLLMVIASLAFMYAVVSTIRLIWIVPRPKPVKYNSPWHKIDAGTLVSLHTARIAYLATVFSLIYKSAFVYMPLAVVVIAVGWARVSKKRHRLVDVIVGGIFGIVVAFAAMIALARF